MNTLHTIPNSTNSTTKLFPGAAGEIETFAMANCLMLLSSQQNAAAAAAAATVSNGVSGGEDDFGRSYPCKTCGRKFPSFQALGGHRASHKKVKPPSELSGEVLNLPTKPKVHACSICGVEFPIGQALGGHMRRHRGVVSGGGGGGGGGGGSAVASSVTTEGSSGHSSDGDNKDNEKKRKMINDDDDDVAVPVLKKSSNSKRVCLDLDLDLKLWCKSELDDDHQETFVNDGDDDNENGDDHDVVDKSEVEEGEIVESVKQDNSKIEEKDVDDDYDFLKFELRLPSYYNR